MVRVAWVSPLPPERSGIADYSAELLPELRRQPGLEIETVAAETAMAGGERHDLVVYQLGNSHEYHTAAYHALLARPGVVTLHEYGLHELVRDLCLAAGRPDLYVEELRYCGGRYGAAAGRRFLDLGVTAEPRAFPLFERIVDRSRAVVVHNDFARRRVLASRPAATVHRISPPASLLDAAGAPPRGPQEARRALRLDGGEWVVGMFGHVTPTRRLGVVARAVEGLRRTRPGARLHLVGEVSPYYDFAADLPARAGEWLVRHGRVSRDEMLLWMSACDVAVNLRFPSLGETSATLLRLLGLGKPVVVSNVGSFAELPDGSCAKVDVDETEGEVLAAILQRVAADDGLRGALGAGARAYYAAHHTPGAAAAAYAEVLRSTAAAPAEVFEPRPPLRRPASDDALSDVVADVSAALVDLLGGEPDGDVLAAAARPINELYGA